MLPLQDHAILALTGSPSQYFLHPKAIQNGIALYRISATFSVSIAFSFGFHLVPPPPPMHQQLLELDTGGLLLQWENRHQQSK